MKLNLFLLIVGVADLVNGALLLLVPAQRLSLYGLTLEGSLNTSLVRLFGGFAINMGVMLVLLRNVTVLETQ